MENSSAVAIFTLHGLNETWANTLIFFALALLAYLLIIILNLTLITTIIIEKTLHEPMYIFLCNLCVNGLYGTAGLFPKLLADFLSDSHVISYAGCYLQIFIIYSSVLCEFTILTVMAYDRYVAICKPLQYNSIMTSQTISKFILVSWIFPFCEQTIGICLSAQLPLCGSHIDKLYCDNWSIVKLSCVDITINNLYGYIVIVINFSQALFIVFSYIQIAGASLRSSEDRNKFMQTCVPHLISVINFSITMFFDLMYSRYGSRNMPQALRNFLAVEFLLIPPLLNPLIYGLKLSQIRRRVMRVFSRKCDILK
ncbi:olfactory receptor 52E4-like [Amia ocellicauda]|uniref:olfactory receptor 52E4-like n=1 Tax=Amia ocellicauda TaxID=2972642 RepID=UPI0034647CD0|nr:O52E4 protein [Amia calva]